MYRLMKFCGYTWRPKTKSVQYRVGQNYVRSITAAYDDAERRSTYQIAKYALIADLSPSVVHPVLSTDCDRRHTATVTICEIVETVHVYETSSAGTLSRL